VKNIIDSTDNPRVGAVANVRNRRGVITAVDEYDSTPEGRFHLVTVEYTDSDGVPEDRLIWEREPGATITPPSALPKVSSTAPMHPHEFDAMLRATRWSAMLPYVDPDDDGPLDRLPISAPFHGAIHAPNERARSRRVTRRLASVGVALRGSEFHPEGLRRVAGSRRL
jgi:hypothetical protein